MMQTVEACFLANQGLAYAALRRCFPRYAFDEDMTQNALLGLWKACRTFKDGYGTFSAYAYPCILNEIRMSLRKTPPTMASLDAPLSEDGGRLAEIIPDKKTDFTGAEMEPGRVLGRLTARQREIVAMRLRGCTQAQIAKRLHVSEATIHRDMRGMRDVFEAHL